MLALLAGAPALLAFGSIAALLLFLVWFSGMLPGWQVPPWKTPYGVAALLYVTCVVLAWRMPWHYAAGDRNFLAASDLPHNHRIRPADLKAPPSFPSEFGFYLPSIRSIAGKYVVVPCLRAGQKVTPASVAAGPDLELPNRNRAISFPLPPEAQFIGDMEPGTTVSLLGQDADTKSAIKILATVHAIVCDKPDTAGELCMPVLYLDDDQIDMTTRNKAALRVALVSPPHQNACQDAPKK